MAYDLIKISALPETTPDESQDIVIGEGDYAKRINYGDVKADMVGTSPTYTTDTEPYLMRRTAHVGVVGKCALNKLVGGSLGWNQLVANGNFESTSSWTARQSTISVANNTANVTPSSNGTERGLQSANYLKATAGHKYIIKVDVNSPITSNVNLSFGGANAIARAVTASAWVAASCVYEATVTATTALYALIAGTTTTSQTIQYRNAMSTDLTLAFGSTIADYIYQLETATVGAGIAKLKSWGIDLGTYHAYDAGSIQSVQATAHVTTGKNLMPQQTDGIIPCFLPKGAHICASCTTPTGATPNLNYYDANRNRIDYWPLTQTYSGGLYRSFVVAQDAYYIAFTNNTALNKQLEFGSSPTAYEPYTAHTYPLGSDTLRGVPQLVSNKLSYDGDIKTPDGTIRRRYGIVDLGTLTWTKYNVAEGTLFRASIDTIKWTNAPTDVPNIICPHYPVKTQSERAEKTISQPTNNSAVDIIDSAYTDATAFKTAMSGVYLVYPLETPTTESSTAYQKVQTIDADGTESFTTSTPVPVGHETQTPDNILAALGWLGE